jgi:UV DNA damage endonuclease
MPHNVGYCCINNTLRKQGVFTGRTMRAATYLQNNGPELAIDLAIQNAKDLITILKWNESVGINVFRMGSGLIPWLTEYGVTELSKFNQLHALLADAGTVANNSGQRITAHPDHFVKLASLKPTVVDASINELQMQSFIFDMMGLSITPKNAINIHVGMNYSPEVSTRFVSAFNRLDAHTKSRLVVENDDKCTGYSVKQLYDDIHKVIQVPITFDYFHHTFHTNNLSSEDAAKLSAFTWKSVTPLFHYSESKMLNENVSVNPRAHADYVFNKIDDYGLDIDIDLEAKAKEQALFRYKNIIETL